MGWGVWKNKQWEVNYRAERLHEDAELQQHRAMMTNAVLKEATNAVPGITAIVDIIISSQDKMPSNWWAVVTVDYVPARGGMARTNLPFRFYDFSTNHPSAHLDYEQIEKDRKRIEALLR